MISMLLPARGRPRNLKSSMDSIFQLAKDPASFEFWVRLDENDPHLQAEFSVLATYPRNQVHVFAGGRLGYSRMHDYYNGLALRAINAGSPKWLFLWNDDIDMLTQNWDQLLRECPPFCVQFPRRDTTPTTDYTLPVIGRPIYDAVSHVSVNAYCDAWISDYSAFAGTSVIRDDIVFHHHRLQDATLAEQQDGGKEWQKFTAQEQIALRRADMEKVIACKGHGARFHGWKVLPVEHVGVDYIKLASGEVRAHAVKLLGRL